MLLYQRSKITEEWRSSVILQAVRKHRCSASDAVENCSEYKTCL